MSIRLTAPTDQLAEAFRKLKTREDVALLLDLPLKQLAYHLFVVKDAYVKFNVKKASGGTREIASPSTALKIIQRKLADVLTAAYTPKGSTHGFVPKRSILSNAQVHLGARFVLNVDLKDFFPSINFGRVRGLFIAKPYELTPEAATVLAQICCVDNALPQGAPTSPIVSNMICGRLDGQLQKLAQRYNCLYTRYADDLTFSTRTSSFPKSLARGEKTEAGESVVAAGELETIISENGFQINLSKTRLQTRKRRQEVTGLTINVFPNVRRKYMSQIRAMLHAWEKFGLERAEQECHSKYYRKHRSPERPAPSYRRILRGKIDFFGMVRGRDDSAYIRFLQHLNRLEPGFTYRVVAGKRTSIDLIRDAVWVLECAYDDKNGEAVVEQGTAFVISGIGLVTCAHVLRSHTYAFRASDPTKRFEVTLIAKNDDLDLAIISVPTTHQIQLEPGDASSVKPLDPVTVLGYPNYAIGDTVFIHQGKVTGFRPRHGIRRILVDAHIVQGNSGGPVLDRDHRVIGLAVTGSSSESSAPQTEAHGVIPIDALNHLKAKT
jgi:RNA-directed DNA polymerase